ncbi:MAG: prepilin-type N-terminal cleavage/methylation domain-containing protein [Candidatus Hydrogenedens sp.]|jgi:prepilin-type N-terminal cleavage/methylation domain-containing protein|nr:prepilin-type N-terminal cleavage/methylation domain-containing protein [Candidatus Hydrogenedens sp.]
MKNKGFTLIELMIVVAIIAIIAAIAIPNLLRSRLQSNEAAAIGNLKTIVGAQTAYAAATKGYAEDWSDLREPTDGPSFLDLEITANGDTLQGYDFNLAGEVEDANGLFQDFEVTADPNQDGTTGIRYFFVNASGIIRQEVGAQADADSTAI